MRRTRTNRTAPTNPTLPEERVATLLQAMETIQILVIGDLMLDHFIWGTVRRISPEAPVPVVEFDREARMPGGAANVARNVKALGAKIEIGGFVGADSDGATLKDLLEEDGVGCRGILIDPKRPTSTKLRIVAGQQQVARLDRERTDPTTSRQTQQLLQRIKPTLETVDAVILADYGKGALTETLITELQAHCRPRAIWMSLDPKPVHATAVCGISLLTPNRKELFDIAGIRDSVRNRDPLQDAPLMAAAEHLLETRRPGLLLVTLGELGLLLCQRNQPPLHIPTTAKEVFDVSGAGDTVIACFTLAIAAGASPVEAAILANHAAGVVVGKFGTATVSPVELQSRFNHVA